MIDFLTAYNNLPTFEEATELVRLADAELFFLGEQLHKLGKTEALGVTLLHKHYEVHPGERIVRRAFPNFTLIHPTKSLDDAYVPVAWMSSGGSMVPLEYAVVADMASYASAVAHIPQLLNLNPLPGVLGIGWSDAYTGGSAVRYELTHEAARLSVVSGWRDHLHQNYPFERSYFGFNFDNEAAKVVLNQELRCPNCSSCNPSHEEIEAALRDFLGFHFAGDLGFANPDEFPKEGVLASA